VTAVLRSTDTLREHAERAGDELDGASALDVLRWADEHLGSSWCVTSSMADAVVAHLAAQVRPWLAEARRERVVLVVVDPKKKQPPPPPGGPNNPPPNNPPPPPPKGPKSDAPSCSAVHTSVPGLLVPKPTG